jgi:hypothetical protein
MAPELAVVLYAAAIVCFLLATWGITGVRRPIALGWLGVALVTVVLLADALKAASTQ